jgi:hypothetical protein
MVSFYDPRDTKEQEKIEKLLHDKGIEYFLRSDKEPGTGPKQLLVAEEDIPAAERVLLKDILS